MIAGHPVVQTVLPAHQLVFGEGRPETLPVAGWLPRLHNSRLPPLDGIVVFDPDLSHFREKKAKLSIHSIAFEVME